MFRITSSSADGSILNVGLDMVRAHVSQQPLRIRSIHPGIRVATGETSAFQVPLNGTRAIRRTGEQASPDADSGDASVCSGGR